MQAVLRHLNLPDTTLRVPASPNGYRMMSRPSPSSSSDTNLPAHQLDHSTTVGAEALLAQTEISDDFFSPQFANRRVGSPTTPPPGGLFNILDDLLNSGPYNGPSSPAGKSSESLGEADPRPNVIKVGAISSADANVLVDQSVSHPPTAPRRIPIFYPQLSRAPSPTPFWVPSTIGRVALSTRWQANHYTSNSRGGMLDSSRADSSLSPYLRYSYERAPGSRF